jgi:hypothetical protein
LQAYVLHLPDPCLSHHPHYRGSRLV